MYTLVYSINSEQNPETVYINLTNACTNDCEFCLRGQRTDVCGHEMWHDNNYELSDVISQFKEHSANVKEVVFCGYGEPFLKKDMMKDFCTYLRKNYPQVKIRVNTNGHANAIYGVDVTEEFKGLIDSVSISLNASTSKEYDEICHPTFEGAYDAVKEFALACKKQGMETSMSVVTNFDDTHEIDVDECKNIAQSLGAKFRNREFIKNGY